MTTTEPLRCSFCSKNQNDVRKLIAGPNVCICDECIEACQKIVAEDTRISGEGALATEPPSPKPSGSDSHFLGCALCGMPTPLEDLLFVAARGPLCPGCIGEIEAALASRAGENPPV